MSLQVKGSGTISGIDEGLNITGVCTATSFSGSGANLTGVSQVGVLNQADNRLITATGTTDSLYAEDNLTYDGSKLAAPKAEFSSTSPFSFISNGATGTFNKTVMYANYNNTSNHVYNGILFDMGHLTDSSAGEVRKFTIGERGGPTNVTFDQNGIHFGHGSGNPTLGSTTGLDDYEEGTWIPLVRNSSGTGTAGSTNYGYYTKVGNIVHAHATVHWTALNSGTTSVYALLVGFPFPSKNATAYRCQHVLGAQVVGVQAGGAGYNLSLAFDGNASHAYLLGVNSASTGGQNYTHTPTLNSTGTIYGLSITYLTDS